MIHHSTTQLGAVSIHQIGSKTEGEGVFISDKPFVCEDPDFEITLKKYFLGGFKQPEYYEFTFSNGDHNMNPLFQYAQAIFENPDLLHNQSVFIAQHLYEKSNHPNIKSGDLMIVYLPELVIEEEVTSALGIYKSEDKESFLKLIKEQQSLSLQEDKGINLNKLDKACLIFNTAKSDGFRMCIKDHSNKNQEARYWVDDFLNAVPCEDDYHHTKQYIELTKSFIKDRLVPMYDIDKTEEAGILHRSKEFFKKTERFEDDEYADRVFFENDKVIDAYKEYKTDLEEHGAPKFEESFFVHNAAVKKNSKFFRSVLKLDKNFHVYIHGNHDLIEKGKDDKGTYYKIYYENES